MNEAISIQMLLQRYLGDYANTHLLDGHRLKVCRHLMNCHTPALGGMQYQCDQCHIQMPLYHSCRDRHCPQCQGRASRRWSEQQQQAILPVTYYHLVFTLPHELNGWIRLHPEVIYSQLFQVAWTTLKTFAADRKRLGGKLGMTAVLHTWGQNLSQHVHLHCLVPGGVLTERQQWQAARSTYLFPVRALTHHFRGKMVSRLRKCATAGKLNRITRADEIDNLLNQLMKKAWVVYSKPCINRTQTVIRYLARYSHKIAISDQRIIGIEADQVHFRYKDYRDDQSKTMKLHYGEFIRRFLMHVLPKGLMRIRHYGLLANRCRKDSLDRIRKILARPATVIEKQKPDELTEYPCPKCHRGHLVPTRLLNPVWQPVLLTPG
ncbi:MAG: IS91 family transposase [Candidatus Thiodiazotropha sp. (ex Troendleina suluensis)]|nr:IS91 family transposase [Candidatus Thiodiazotropha sp. (ex Troendleina suluensis)]